ncbi:Na+/H+ antiporter subunit E [Pseudofrankia inefficax]|uniref:Uncharacterized protein n=1 Tax=Pseudofrankia inefficax (strain DSM 45817 / CECT 9037 / DDB 130130 / EuI1c) TaxID=298654 RepID=E3J8G4_PSEI1|nr:Na+/H+ antiporter subunit E [Pseudofrankia inefficax]ADP84498.1 hypothetical protein FraEuI1c_6522 [Pseudofrankia inefficax]
MRRDRRWIGAAVWVFVGAAVWLVSLASLAAVSVAECVAALVAGVLGATAAALGRRAIGQAGPGSDARGRREPHPRARWRLVARLPAAVLADTGRVFVQAARRDSVGGLRVLYLDAAGEGAHAARNRVAATMLLGVTPGTYVTDVDRDTGVVTIHALVPPSATERALDRSATGPPADGERRETR